MLNLKTPRAARRWPAMLPHPQASIINPGTAAPPAFHHAPQAHQFHRRGPRPTHPMPRENRVIGRWREPRRHVRLRRTGTDQPGATSCAKCKAEAVKQDGLAGARLTGQHGKAGAKAQIEPFVSHNNISDGERCQHGACAKLGPFGLSVDSKSDASRGPA